MVELRLGEKTTHEFRSLLKQPSTELARRAAHLCAQFHGARGYLSESESARLYRDATAGTIAAGASELVREIIFDSVDPEALLDQAR
ncbi:alkylation response protein AidB-like acyl-CoA dehydrogenase [Paraburkholderia sp. GAS333]|uniref:acyl-CoA dehydrogenase family protein n=1 Tax=Paraburkholderia sp. GAS333 TaxID=3156279 RepID=UPI003D237C0D